MSRQKKTGVDRLDVNILVPFAGPQAEEIKKISHANGLPNTVVVRMIIAKGLEAIHDGKELKLVMPQ